MTPEKAAATEGALIGHSIDERYRLEGVIGVGGLGSVYRATHTKLQRPVAVKMLHESFGESQVQRGRFAREAKALAALQHPNIVAVLDYGVSDARPYLVMELLEGETLSQRLHRGPLSVEAALPIIQQLLEALAFMHRAKLVHRDVKPSNVFLQRMRDGQDRVKVLDLGLAKFTAHPSLSGGDPTLTRDGAILGTPAYMSPEQATGEAVDARSDVYAVGVILYRMLSGRLPFEGDAIEQVRSHLIAPVPSLERAEPDESVDPAFESLIRHAMAKRREDRFDDAGQMLKALVEAFPQHVRATLPAHEPVLPDPFTVDAANAEWLLSKSDDPSDAKTMPRVPRVQLDSGVQRIGRAMKTLVITSVRLFAGVSVLLVVGAGAIFVLVLRDEADRAELTALQRRVSDRLIERSLRGGAGSAAESSRSPATARDGRGPAVEDAPVAAPARDGRAPAAVDAPAAPDGMAVAQGEPTNERAPAPTASAEVSGGEASNVRIAAPAVMDPTLALPTPSSGADPPAASGSTPGASAPGAIATSEQATAPESATSAPTPGAATGTSTQALQAVSPAGAATGTSTQALQVVAPKAGAATGASTQALQAAVPNAGVATVASTQVLEGGATKGGSATGALESSAVAARSDAAQNANAANEPTLAMAGAAAPELVPQPSAASTEPAASTVATVAPRDPWHAPVPARLRAARKSMVNGGRGSEPMFMAVREYNKDQREDPRGHLILGQLYLNRFWRADALSQFSIAMQLDPSVRGAPEVLEGLLVLVVHGALAAEAERVILNRFGPEAVPAIERAIEREKRNEDPKVVARLRRLHVRVTLPR